MFKIAKDLLGKIKVNLTNNRLQPCLASISYDCSGSCEGSCYGGCYGSCNDTCLGGCEYNCQATCADWAKS